MLRRIVTRTGLGLWHQRGTVLIGGAVVAALGAYLLFLAPALSSGGSAAAGATGHDCADTVMAAMAGAGLQQQAYQCMDASYQQRVSEQQFSNQLQTTSRDQSITHVARVGTYDAPTGPTLVYYAVDTNNASLGFIVYLGTNGKVLTIE
jgi:hypothetical protein